eukprot:TRINITY_DN198_c0_g1_i1.p1 TRINITY_DN198_c0_g1~~TRINITY_DN198_c0_g1_i1.p1  ORF type:complete len:204 (+),score=34.32 TRINITY_DN198_c0_g1_i1:177-788(+)
MSSELLQHTFRHSWRDCALASWQKWPNPQRPDVLSVDIINKRYDEETGVLYATRLLILKSFLPTWVRALTGGHSLAYFVEESVTDPHGERLVLHTTNLTLENLLQSEETCVYTHEHRKEEGEFTKYEQQVLIKANAWGVAKKLERWSVDTFVANAQKGREIMEDVIRRVEKEASAFQKGLSRFDLKKEESSLAEDASVHHSDL